MDKKSENNTNAIETAIKLGKSLGEVKHINGVPAVMRPDGYEVMVFDELEPKLTRIKETRNLQTLDSFVQYINDYDDGKTALFVDDDKHIFTAVFDYHQKGQPDHCDFKAVYHCPFSDEWKEWSGSNKARMSQFDFASFIENNIEDIVEPSGAEMLSCALALESTKKADFSSSIRLNNGEVQLKYEENIQGASKNSSVNIPEVFSIGLPVFKKGEPYKVRCRLRYRINDGNLALWYEMIKPSRVIDDAFDGVKEAVDNLTRVLSIYT